MADLQEIGIRAIQSASKLKPQKKRSTPKSLNKQERSSDELSTSNGSGHNDFLSMLKGELRLPFLGMLEDYARRCSPTKNKKDLGKSMFIFKESHRFIFWLCFSLDIILLVIFIFIVLYVGLRGLQINPFGLIS